MDGRVGKRSVERVRYVINKLHLEYGVISLVLCISTRLRLVTILTILVKYLVIFHADPCNYGNGSHYRASDFIHYIFEVFKNKIERGFRTKTTDLSIYPRL